jgi:alginate O-acetyltransferase complex protein AlgJ
MAASTPRPAHDWRPRPWAEHAIAAMVVAALAAPGLATAVGLGRDAQRDEAPAPQAGGALASAAAAFDGQFAFRARFVAAQAWLRTRVFGVSPLLTVWRGRDGWWFYADDGAVEDATNASALTEAELDDWRTTLQRTRDWLAASGIAYVFVIAPDKPTIYPEFLPAGIHVRPGPTRVDQVVAELRAKTTVPVIDLRAPLRAAKADARIYHRTDSHWNDLGAVMGYRAIVGALHDQTSLVQPPYGRDAFDAITRDEPGWDLAGMLGLAGTIRETAHVLELRRPRRARIVEPPPDGRGLGVPRLVTEVDDASLPRAVFYRDSFGSALVPFLAEHFRRMVVLWEYDIVPATIREERPDVVIQEWAGRRLHTRLPFDAIAADAAAAADLTRSAPARR